MHSADQIDLCSGLDQWSIYDFVLESFLEKYILCCVCVCVPPPVVLLMKLKLSTFSGNTEVCPLIPLTYNIAGAVTTAMAVYLYTGRHMCAVLRESEHQR